MDDFAPVTRADLKGEFKALRGELKLAFEEVHTSLRRLYETDDQILTVLSNVDKRLTGKVTDHEHRIGVLERQVA